MSRLRILLVPCLVTIIGIGMAAPSLAEEAPSVERVVVNRIVAIIDQDVITLVELQRRAKPFQARLREVPPDKRAAAESQLHKDLLQTAIDERLIAREARMLQVTIGTDEINNTLDTIAKSKSIKREKLLELAAEQGFSEAQYREQLVRQLLIAKLMRIKLSEQLKAVDKDPDKASKQLDKLEKFYLQGLRANVFIEVRL